MRAVRYDRQGPAAEVLQAADLPAPEPGRGERCRSRAAADLTAASRDGALSISAETLLPLERAAQAHDRVDQGTRGRVLLAIPD